MQNILSKITGIRHVNPSTIRKKSGQIVSNTIVYLLLFEFVFVFLYPFIFMLLNSFKFDYDFRDLNRQWVLSGVNIDNYKNAIKELEYFSTAFVNVSLVLLTTLGHVISCSFIAYGISRFDFKGKNLVFTLVILSILVPLPLLQMPLYIQYARIGWLTTILPIVIPSFFGFGLKGGVYIFIFMQFFKGLPKSYEESAKIEGCNSFKVYYKIILPLSKTSILVVSTLSSIWHWNDVFEPAAYLTGKTQVLSQMLRKMPAYLYWSTSATGSTVTPVQLAACVMIILPIMIMFLIIQKKFMAGIEFSGLAN